MQALRNGNPNLEYFRIVRIPGEASISVREVQPETLKILFVCSCLESGIDGVGDYTRRLAVEVDSRGHTCQLLALADPHVQQASPFVLSDSHSSLQGLRLPASDSWANRVRQARLFFESVGPDWISWQIVLYGYDPRGLSFGLGARLKEIAGTCRNEIMLHEIWIGEAQGSPFKNRLIGKIQRLLIKDLLRKLSPGVVHTHTPLYQHLLSGLGCQAKLLPLFGNIPLAEKPDAAWLRHKWPELADLIPAESRGNWWLFVIFGSIHPEWDAEDFRQRVLSAAQPAGKKCALISIGRPGTSGEEKLREMQTHESESWKVRNLGPQSEFDISQCLLAADFGVSAVPPEYISKSGTATAMIEHGLHVIATRPPYRYRNYPADLTAVGMRNVITQLDLEGQTKTTPGSLLPSVASQFIEDLQRARNALLSS